MSQWSGESGKGTRLCGVGLSVSHFEIKEMWVCGVSALHTWLSLSSAESWWNNLPLITAFDLTIPFSHAIKISHVLAIQLCRLNLSPLTIYLFIYSFIHFAHTCPHISGSSLLYALSILQCFNWMEAITMAEASCHPHMGSSSQHPSSMGLERGSWEQRAPKGSRHPWEEEALTQGRKGHTS